MEYSLLEIFAAGAGMLAVWMCGITRVRTLLTGMALQSAALAGIALIIGLRTHLQHFLLLALAVLLIKAIAIPCYLAWATARLGVREDRGATLSPTLALLLGCAILGAGYFASPLIATTPTGNAGTAGMALALVLVGMLLMMGRRLAISQVIGFLVMENGIFLYGLTQTSGMPLLVEMGVIFDVLVGVLVAGLVIFRLNRSFEHIDVTQFRGLRH
jgi:hydrogenase-4 component E